MPEIKSRHWLDVGHKCCMTFVGADDDFWLTLSTLAFVKFLLFWHILNSNLSSVICNSISRFGPEIKITNEEIPSIHSDMCCCPWWCF